MLAMRLNVLTVTIQLVLTSLVSGQFPFGSDFQAPRFPLGTTGDQTLVKENNSQQPGNQRSAPNFNSNGGDGGGLGGNNQKNNQRALPDANANYRTHVPSDGFPSSFKPLIAVNARQQPRGSRFGDAQNSQGYPVNRALLQSLLDSLSNQGHMRNAPMFSNQPSHLNRRTDPYATRTLPQSNEAQRPQGSTYIRPPLQPFMDVPPSTRLRENAPSFSNQPSQLNRNSDPHVIRPLTQSNGAQSLQFFPNSRPPLKPFRDGPSNQGPMRNVPMFSNHPSQLNRNFYPHGLSPLLGSHNAQNSQGSPINSPPLQPFLTAPSNQESNANREKGFVPPHRNIFQPIPENVLSALQSMLKEPSNIKPDAPSLQKDFSDFLPTNGPINANPNQNRNQPEINEPNPILRFNQGKPQDEDNSNQSELDAPNPIFSSNQEKPQDEDNTNQPELSTPNLILSSNQGKSQDEDNTNQPELGTPNPILSSNQGKSQDEDHSNQPELDTPNPTLSSNQEKPQDEDNSSQPESDTPNPILSSNQENQQSTDKTGLQYDQTSTTSPTGLESTDRSVVLTDVPLEQLKTVTVPAGFLLDLLSSLDVGEIHTIPTNRDFATKPTDSTTTTSLTTVTVSTTASTTQHDTQNDGSSTKSVDITPTSSSTNIPEITSEESSSTIADNNEVTKGDSKVTQSVTVTETTSSVKAFGDLDETEEPETCGEDEQWWDCMPLLHNTCDNFARARARQDSECKPGCFCMDDLVRTSDGQCVDPDDCPDPICDDNEEETDCLNQCDTCEASCRPCSLEMCEPGCDCKDGYKRSANGTCIHAVECPVCTSSSASAATTQSSESK